MTAIRTLPFLSLVLLGASGCRATSSRLPTSALPDTTLLGRDVRYLASDALEGRRTGTPGNDSAAAYIARRLRALGVEPLVMDPAACTAAGNSAACRTSYLQPFVAKPAAAARTQLPADLPTQNVVGLIRGTDLSLRGQYVVLGAHFDHLGRMTFGALDPEVPNQIHNGADDNASGTAAVMELARLLEEHRPRRSVLVVLFTGEELGLLGSQYFVDHAPVPLDSVQAMLNFDMVGRLRDDRLIVYGAATAAEFKTLLDSLNLAPPFRISAVGDGFGPSDQSSFYAKDLPVLHFFTDLHEDYHRATDDADKINVAGMARVVAYAERITRTLADRPGRLSFVRVPVTAARGSQSSASSSGSQVYMGTIPDMGASDAGGMLLSGVSPGSPADSAGLRAGDLIVELAGVKVTDLYSYSDALYTHQPGDKVSLVYLRGGQRFTTSVTLGRRGG